LEANARQRADGLIAAAVEGNMAAFDELVRANIDAVYGHGLRFFGEPQAAEDVVQEVFIKVYRQLDTFEGDAAFTTWLFRVTRNVCLDMLRQGKRRPLPIDPIDLAAGSTPDHSDRVVDAAALEQAMQALQPEDREALNAVALFGLSYEEAADSIGIPVGTVKSRVFRARRTLVSVMAIGGAGR
jgi:RNA polymerase sigma-70 factor (ECF subfamily)